MCVAIVLTCCFVVPGVCRLTMIASPSHSIRIPLVEQSRRRWRSAFHPSVALLSANQPDASISISSRLHQLRHIRITRGGLLEQPCTRVQFRPPRRPPAAIHCGPPIAARCILSPAAAAAVALYWLYFLPGADCVLITPRGCMSLCAADRFYSHEHTPRITSSSSSGQYFFCPRPASAFVPVRRTAAREIKHPCTQKLTLD